MAPSFMGALLLAVFLSACGGEGRAGSAGTAGAVDTVEEAGDPDTGEVGDDVADPSPTSSGSLPAGIPEGGLVRWVEDIREGLEAIRSAESLDADATREIVLDLYVGRQEYIEIVYGLNGEITGADHPELGEAVLAAEARFHELMQLTGGSEPDRTEILEGIRALEAQLDTVMERARAGEVPLDLGDRERESQGGAASVSDQNAEADGIQAGARRARSAEIREILTLLERAEGAYRAGDHRGALKAVETAYLEGLEPLESRLPRASVQRVERLIHLTLRPALSRGAPAADVHGGSAALRAELLAADPAVAGGSSFWFGATSAFAIILREGLEAVLLVGAMLAYLGKVEGGAAQRPRIYAGVGAGVVASFLTWGLARTLVPIDGANRELLEGVTALLAVVVLVYVSNWIFRRSYIHHWKDFLQERLGQALTAGSGLAMALLAFAAVYREGFETVLFYQALLFDVGATSMLAGFVPGALLIVALAVGIVRLGLRLPLGRVFAGTNAVLLYLAFLLTGKGVYNLQEAGLFAPHPVGWVPDAEAFRFLLGIYPVAETLLAQALLAGVVAGTWVYYRRRIARRVAAADGASVTAAERVSVAPSEEPSVPAASAPPSASRERPASVTSNP